MSKDHIYTPTNTSVARTRRVRMRSAEKERLINGQETHTRALAVTELRTPVRGLDETHYKSRQNPY